MRRAARARVGDRRQRALELLAQVLVLRREPQRLAEVLGVLVDREAGGEGRDLEQDPARLAEVDRAEVVAVAHVGHVAAGVARRAACQARWSSSREAQAMWCTVPAPWRAAARRRGS